MGRKHRTEKRAWVGAYKMKIGCVDCGWLPDDGDHSQLDLDHLPEFEKFMAVSDMVSGGYSWSRIKEEVKKCEVVCRPCHNQRTHTRSWAAVGKVPPDDLPDPY